MVYMVYNMFDPSTKFSSEDNLAENIKPLVAE